MCIAYKKDCCPFLISVLLPFDYFFSHYPYACYYSVTILNILMKLYNNVYGVKTVCHHKKIALSFLVSELLCFDKFFPKLGNTSQILSLLKTSIEFS